MQQIFERLQVFLPEEVDASIRKQADAAANSTRLQQEIQKRQNRIAQLAELNIDVQKAQLKIAEVDAQVAIRQRQDIKDVLEKTREERRADFNRLVDIQSFISKNQGGRAETIKAGKKTIPI